MPRAILVATERAEAEALRHQDRCSPGPARTLHLRGWDALTRGMWQRDGEAAAMKEAGAEEKQQKDTERQQDGETAGVAASTSSK